jgi:hypothetical protein
MESTFFILIAVKSISIPHRSCNLNPMACSCSAFVLSPLHDVLDLFACTLAQGTSIK